LIRRSNAAFSCGAPITASSSLRRLVASLVMSPRAVEAVVASPICARTSFSKAARVVDKASAGACLRLAGPPFGQAELEDTPFGRQAGLQLVVVEQLLELADLRFPNASKLAVLALLPASASSDWISFSMASNAVVALSTTAFSGLSAMRARNLRS
jgi:hypothetical protein